MNNKWSVICHGVENFKVNGDQIEATFADGRQHRVQVQETDQTFELTSVVSRAGQLNTIIDLPLRAWQRNRATQLVGFRIDQRGRLLGEAWIPKASITAEGERTNACGLYRQ